MSFSVRYYCVIFLLSADLFWFVFVTLIAESFAILGLFRKTLPSAKFSKKVIHEILFSTKLFNSSIREKKMVLIRSLSKCLFTLSLTIKVYP